MSWPIACPDCGKGGWGGFTYVSDRSGNVRKYKCDECGAVYIATIKDMRSTGVGSEPKNMNSDELYWEKIRT